MRGKDLDQGTSQAIVPMVDALSRPFGNLDSLDSLNSLGNFGNLGNLGHPQEHE